MIEIDIATQQIKTDEGLRLHPYTCTAGKVTIGYGRNLDDVGITSEEADVLLSRDVEVARLDAEKFTGSVVWGGLTPARKAVIINMAFNLGITRLSKFKRLHHSLAISSYDEAAKEMLNSRWAHQVGARADRLAESMRHG